MFTSGYFKRQHRLYDIVIWSFLFYLFSGQSFIQIPINPTMADTWFQEQFAKLQIDTGNRLGGLSEIHEKLQALNPGEIAEVVSSSAVLSTVFSCVEKQSSKQTTIACDILSLCFSSLDLNSERDENVLLLDDLIRHSNDEVKVIGLTQLERLVRKHPEQTHSESMLLDVIQCLELPSTSVGALAMKILKLQLPRHFDSSNVMAAIESAGGTSSTAKCRVYEVVVSVSVASVQNLRRLSTILDRIVSDLASDDILLQLNVMEILSELVCPDFGLAYLEEQSLFPRLMVALENIDMMHILFPGFIKFFGSIANSHPDKIFTKFSHICKPLFETIISNDSSTLSPCLDTLGVLGRSKQGKIGLSGLNLVNPDGDMKMVLMEMAMFLNTLPTEEQIRILNCLEMLFRWQVEEEEGGQLDAASNPDNRICMITETWYKHLDRGPRDSRR